MHPLHERAARIGLAATGRFGFALAGGYAVQAHGFLSRQSEDVDLFTVADAPGHFDDAVAVAVAAYRDAGFDVAVTLLRPTFARLILTDTDGEQVRIEFAVDWRSHAPVTLSIGPVLHADDAVANKVTALFGRGEVRDYIDVAAVLRSDRYSRDDLIRLASNADAGFDVAMFAEALRAIQRLPDRAFAVHNLDPAQIADVRSIILDWASQLDS
jgi:predicted nucleotidyltransferase component of viral defense system